MRTTNSISTSKRITIVVFLGCAIAVATTALLPSTELTITDSCQISGPMQKLKSVAQGSRFWDKQLQLLDDTVQDLEAQPESMRKTQQMSVKAFHEALEMARQQMAETYSKYPELRPLPRQTIAGTLREQADAIEFAGALDMLARGKAQRIRSLASCRPAILAARVTGDIKTPQFILR